ncbi:MAG: preprotein translocase subunit SecY [Desulfurococcales archaeon ex4484_42]|nr:MAG: preprotein translocase subunit SecY [Desulfurococcales archaeon ex4484_42]
MGLLRALAIIGDYFPSPPRPARRPDLKRRLFYTFLALIAYFLMASTQAFPLAAYPQAKGPQLPVLINIIFASARGSIAQLGIGPLVTAGLIIQILAGAKLIELDLTKPEDRKLFTQAEKGLALIIALVEGLGFALYYRATGGLNMYVIMAIYLQFVFGAIVLMIMDEAIQKGWGIGSGVSLFILAGVARRIAWDMFSTVKVADQYYGFFPYIVDSVINGSIDMNRLFFGLVRVENQTYVLPTLTGFIVTLILIFVLVYLQQMKVNIPVVTQRAPGIRTRVPLQFLYVTNIPILLVGIVFSDLLLLNNLASAYLSDKAPWIANALRALVYYLAPPRSMLEVAYNPLRVTIFAIALVGLALLFGFMWVEIAGLSPSAQAENLIKAGLEIRGVRRNPKLLEAILGKYIYPLTFLSSLIVALIALIADIFSAYGTGMGILLAVGIVQQFYTLIAYERALEAYPLLKRLIGE